MKNKRILITGSHGFIGQTLMKRLLPGNTLQVVFRSDWYEAGFKEKLVEFNPDIIIHAGAYGNHSSQTDELETFEANIVKTFMLLRDTIDIPYEAFINISTSRHILDCDSLYGATKMCGEYLARSFAKKYQKPIISVRPASITGKGEQPAHLIPQLIESCLTGKEIPFVGWPEHNFLDVQDLVDAIILLATKAKDYRKLSFSVGGDRTYSNEEIKRIVEFMTGMKANVKKVISMRSYDSTDWNVDSTLIRSFGWKPKVSIEQSIEEQVASMVESIDVTG